jgi:HlyD family secretion protein
MASVIKKRRSRMRWLIAAATGLTVVASAVVLSGALKSDNSIDASKLASTERGDIAKSVVATGKVEPLSKVEVKSKASGIVRQLFVDYGDQVKRGQILVELDKEQLQARVREASAFLNAAQAARQSAYASFERNKVDAEGPDVPFLKANVDRQQKLLESGVVARSSMDDAERAYQMAVNRQSSAQRNVAVAQADMARAQAQVAEAQAALDRAQEDLRNSTIVSTMDGLVLSRDVEVGDAVSSILVLGSQATLMMTLGDVSSVYVLGKVDEADIGKVYMGQPARITVESLAGEKFEGRVTKISPLGVEKDNVTTFEVRVSIDNASGDLKANMSVNAEVILEEKKGVLLIPESAVIYDKDRNTSVEIPDTTAENGRQKVPVKLGISNGVKTEVLEGLEEGKQVILQ